MPTRVTRTDSSRATARATLPNDRPLGPSGFRFSPSVKFDGLATYLWRSGDLHAQPRTAGRWERVTVREAESALNPGGDDFGEAGLGYDLAAQRAWEKAHPRAAEALREAMPPFVYDPTWQFIGAKTYALLDGEWTDVSSNPGLTSPNLGEDLEAQRRWEKANPALARARRASFSEGLDAATASGAARRRVWQAVEAANRPEAIAAARRAETEAMLRRNVPGYAHRMRQIEGIVDEQSRRQANGAFAMPAGGHGAPAGAARRPRVVRVDVPAFEPGPRPGADDGGPNLVDLWIRDVDRRWDAATSPR